MSLVKSLTQSRCAPVGVASTLVEIVRPEEQRLPQLDVRRRQLEFGRHDSDDLDVRAVQHDRAADRSAVGAEPLAEAPVGEGTTP